MFSQYFGHYLLNRGLITNEQLQDVLEYQEKVHVKFGVIAVDKGLMTPSQVEEVHEKQKQMDKRFGEIAVELGYLTEEQVEELISHQKRGHLYLAQALIDRGYMSMEEFSSALNDYKKEYSLSTEDFEEIQRGNIETLVENILTKGHEDIREKFGSYISLFAKNMIRFIDRQTFLEISENLQQAKWLVSQEIVGGPSLLTAIAADDEALLYIASKHAEENLTEVDELAKDAFCEFLNLHNGIYLVNMSNWGTELSMNPQKFKENVKVSGEFVTITVKTQKGTFHLLLSANPEKVEVQ
ncbi:hypothetical protein ACFPN4_12085 [Ureibacillus thermophilus]|uniref:hypothetical protein n=1 Tax=Ureibacillus thermophilus TaxID=367743 RepID=UPI003612557E